MQARIQAIEDARPAMAEEISRLTVLQAVNDSTALTIESTIAGIESNIRLAEQEATLHRLDIENKSFEGQIARQTLLLSMGNSSA